MLTSPARVICYMRVSHACVTCVATVTITKSSWRDMHANNIATYRWTHLDGNDGCLPHQRNANAFRALLTRHRVLVQKERLGHGFCTLGVG